MKVLFIIILLILLFYFTESHLKVDMVFTYVDGNDPAFIKKKRYYKGEDRFNPEIRHKNINEIYYSVLSVIKFIPWINKIYIVTDNQIPPIDKKLLDSGKVKIISHEQIIPQKYLPTFNSDVIESFLHNIPELSEVFLYNNDDNMHLDYVQVKDIYGYRGNNIIFNVKNEITPCKIKFFASQKNPNEYIQRLLLTVMVLKNIDPNIILVNNHHTKILRKSTMKYIENKYYFLLDHMRQNKFRGNNYIQYLLFLITIDNHIHKNKLSKNFKDVIELHFEKNYYNGVFDDIYIKKYKFVCLNSMNFSYRDPFYKLMEYKLNN